jgi:hypothetical protein
MIYCELFKRFSGFPKVTFVERYNMSNRLTFVRSCHLVWDNPYFRITSGLYIERVKIV